ncbi:MAG: ASCH domain-containing protein [Acidovorax sp.]|jgi:hypothetical protein|nr:ASCH domain-containing protein [Acidovorax sp.]
MKETGLMFKAPLVRAILAGQKTQTRRVVKSRQGLYPACDNWSIDSIRRNYGDPYGQPGDRIYVRETWAPNTVEPVSDRPAADFLYAATDAEKYSVCCWRPSIHMPKAAARIWLEVTGVRVERLQQITDADALSEGVDRTNTSIPGYARERFRALWESTGGDWGANPWIWAIEFRVLSTTGRPA